MIRTWTYTSSDLVQFPNHELRVYMMVHSYFMAHHGTPEAPALRCLSEGVLWRCLTASGHEPAQSKRNGRKAGTVVRTPGTL